jgi:hypothetical protein
MKYEAPEVAALTPAINAIQGAGPSKHLFPTEEGILPEDVGAYADWEE